MKIDGRCHCGFITYEAEIDPEEVWLCHCTDCQTLSGSAFRTVTPTRKGAFTLLSGEVKTYGKIGSSGARRCHAFCPECGSPIYATSESDGPKVYNLRVGTIRQRRELVPREQVWCRSALPWTTDIKTQNVLKWNQICACKTGTGACSKEGILRTTRPCPSGFGQPKLRPRRAS